MYLEINLCFDSLMSYPYWIKLDTGFELYIFKNIMSSLGGTGTIVLLGKSGLLGKLMYLHIFINFLPLSTNEKNIPFHYNYKHHYKYGPCIFSRADFLLHYKNDHHMCGGCWRRTNTNPLLPILDVSLNTLVI